MWRRQTCTSHLTYAVVTFGLAVIGAGNFYGLDASVGPMFSPGLRRWFFSGDKTPPATTG
ncbi:MAG: hypothetical protein ACXWNW_05885 [Isosphaeraceae bacterium]